MWQLVTSLDAWAALVSLAALEIVLGVDNVIFISILIAKATHELHAQIEGQPEGRFRLSVGPVRSRLAPRRRW